MLPTSLPRTQANPAGWATCAAAGDTDHIRSPRRGSMVGGVSIRPRPVVEVKAISTPTPPAEIAPGIDYFFALRPDDRARAEIADAAARFRRAQRASGVPVPIDNLHLLLCPMGRPERLRQSPEHALLAAGAAVRAHAFVVTLDTAMRCIPVGGQFPFVLCADPAATEATLQLRKAIGEAQRAQGLRVSGVSSFHPHVALQHGPAIDAIEESVPPIQWRAEEFVLIRSFFGQSSHEVVGRWPLPRVPAPAPVDLLAELANLPELPSLPDEP